MPTFRLDPRSSTPIWSQIEQQLQLLIGRGALRPGDAVPSVRELARDLVVNPATVSKAYQRLSDLGVLEVRRGQGTFVATAPAAEQQERVAAEVERALEQFVTLARAAGWNRTGAKRRLGTVWNAQESERDVHASASSSEPRTANPTKRRRTV